MLITAIEKRITDNPKNYQEFYKPIHSLNDDVEEF